jgi:hypothetical protein
MNVLLRLLYRLMSIATRAETIAVVCEFRLKFQADYLMGCLLLQTICHGWNAKEALCPVVFGYFYP